MSHLLQLGLGLLLLTYLGLFVWFVCQIRVIAEHVPERSRHETDAQEPPHDSAWHP